MLVLPFAVSIRADALLDPQRETCGLSSERSERIETRNEYDSRPRPLSQRARGGVRGSRYGLASYSTRKG